MYHHATSATADGNLQHYQHNSSQHQQQQQQQQQQHHHQHHQHQHHQTQTQQSQHGQHQQHGQQQQQQQQQQQHRSAYPQPAAPLPSMHAPMAGPNMGQYPYAAHEQQYTLPPPSAAAGHASSAVARPVQRGFAGNDGRYKFRLVVEQQPQRARMCGFGDKDRRPITPPPCVRLVVTDVHTDKPVNISDIDGSYFVLQVDLWDAMAQREVNIVRASAASPAVSISTATTTSFPPTPERPSLAEYAVAAAHAAQQPTPILIPGPDGNMIAVGGGYPSMHRSSMGGATSYSTPFGYPPQPFAAAAATQPYGYATGGSQNGAQFTRNLIGSLTVNASRLKDPDGQEGFWFVLQDLSVRTDGHFRLKLNFIDVGAQGGLNRGRSDVLASAFSDTFQVYSAKKFPGVIESTALSKCFASQGIKIPIRKDVKGDRDDNDDD